MPKKYNYEDQANYLAQSIDTAIDAFKKFPPHEWNENHTNHIIKFYLDVKERVQNPQPQFKNKTSFKYLVNDVFTYFNESEGNAVNYFWSEIRASDLPYYRENKMAKILKRNKIKDQIEYDFVTDVMVAYQQEGLITNLQANALGEMIEKFQNRPNHLPL